MNAAVDAKPNISFSALNAEHISQIAEVFTQYTFNEALNMAKHKWPEFRFIGCSEYDMGEKEPFQRFEGFSFFLMAASLGCASLTYDLSKSVGLIVAEHEDD